MSYSISGKTAIVTGAANGIGLAIARHFEGHAKVERVIYPGLESHPYHAVAKASMRGYGVHSNLPTSRE